MHGDAGLHRQQCAQPGHHVGCGPQADVSIGLGAATAACDRGCVELGGRALQPGDQLAGRESLDGLVVCAQLLIHQCAVLGAQAPRLAGDQRGLERIDTAGPEGGAGVGQLGAQDHREGDLLLTAPW